MDISEFLQQTQLLIEAVETRPHLLFQIRQPGGGGGGGGGGEKEEEEERGLMAVIVTG